MGSNVCNAHGEGCNPDGGYTFNNHGEEGGAASHSVQAFSTVKKLKMLKHTILILTCTWWSGGELAEAVANVSVDGLPEGPWGEATEQAEANSGSILRLQKPK